MTEMAEADQTGRRYRLSLEFGAADDRQAERLGMAWAGTAAAEWDTCNPVVTPAGVTTDGADMETAALDRAREVYRKFFTNVQLGRDSYRDFIGKLQAELFEALHGKPRSNSLWLNEISPEQHEAENPHHPCGKEQTHEGHVWRGSRREFGGACEVMRTYWCEGVVSGREVP